MKKGEAHHLLFIQGSFVPSLVKIDTVFLEKTKLWKLYKDYENDNIEDDDNDEQIWIRKEKLSLWLMLAKKL